MPAVAEIKPRTDSPHIEQPLDRRGFFRHALGLHNVPRIEQALPQIDNGPDEYYIKNQVRGLLRREINRREAMGEIGKAAAIAYTGGKQAEKGIKGFFRELLAPPELTSNYEVGEFAMRGGRLVMMAALDGSNEKRLVVVDIDFLGKEGLGKDIGSIPVDVITIDVNGDNIVAGGKQRSDPTKGALWYTQHGGKTYRILSNETGTIQGGPIQKAQIPCGYDPYKGYNPNDRNTVIFRDSNGVVKVLDMTTGAVTTLSGSVPAGTTFEGPMEPFAQSKYTTPSIVGDQAGYTPFIYDTAAGKFVRAEAMVEGTNNSYLIPRFVQYIRESDNESDNNNKRVTLTFNGNTRPTGTMNYNVDDRLLYSIPLNIDDPVYHYPGGVIPSPSAGAEGKKLYVAVSEQGEYDPTIGNFRRHSFLVEIDPANGYDNVSKQKVIGSSANGLPEGVIKAVHVVKDGEGGDIPVLVYAKGVYVQNWDGNFVKIQIEKKPKYKVFLPTAMVRKLVTGGW